MTESNLPLLQDDSPKPGMGKKREIPHRWMYVLSLNMTGYPSKEIAELSGYSLMTVYKILSDDRIIGIRQQILRGLDAELEALYPQVIQTMRDALYHPDMKFRLDAVEKWFKSHGKYKQDGSQVNVTAEDVVVNILNQGV